MAIAALLLVPAAAQAQATAPSVVCLLEGTPLAPRPSLFVQMWVGGVSLNLTQCLRGTGKVHDIAADFILAGISQGRVTAQFNEDPFINFGITTTNIVAGPLDYQFTFGTPIVPGFYTSATSSLSGSLTGGQSPTSSVTNLGGVPFLRASGTLGGVPVPPALGAGTPGNLGVDIGFGPCNATTGSVNCPTLPASDADVFAPVFYDDLDATVTYTQSGLLSQTSFTGRVDIFNTTVPEPATLSLFAIGAAALGVGTLARRRQR